jgi:mono/diheme cytochrome c family protein
MLLVPGKFARALLLISVLMFLDARASRAQDVEFFEKKIRPILVEYCYECHSAQAKKLKGNLHLDTKEKMLRGGDSGPAVVPGDPDSSLLIRAVRYLNSDLQMPPKNRLSEAQVADLVAWVRAGAPDPRSGGVITAQQQSGWDYEALRKQWQYHNPQDPQIPTVKNRKWPKSPIDHFILSKLEAEKLKPNLPADKRTLIRRATFDLTGLPPTPEEVDAFLSDKSPDAFARVVDRLLSSPHYGERWGRHWLDVVRYADSADARVTGGADDFAEAWRYRDWVVNAFNKDLPYDQFVTQQIAGDLLSPPQSDEIDTNAIIATGMYAIGNWGNGDADKDKVLTDIADDAVDVTGRAFLGLTLACARCHDHKFDPISTADYYSMAGIFFSSHIIPKLTPKGAGETMLRIPLISKAETERRKQRETRMAELEKQIEKLQDDGIAALARTILPQSENYLVAIWEHRRAVGDGASLSEVSAARGLNPAALKRWSVFLSSGNLGLFSTPVPNLLDNRGLHAWRNAAGADTPSIVANSTDLETAFLSIKLPAQRLALHPSRADGVAAAWKSPLSGEVQLRGRVVDVDPNCGDGLEWELLKITATNAASLAKGAIGSGGMEEISGKGTSIQCQVRPGDFLQLNIHPKSGHACDTTMVELEVIETGGQKRTWNINKDVAPDLLASNPHSDNFGNSDIWYFRDLADKSLNLPAGSAMARWLDLLKQPEALPLADMKSLGQKVQAELLTQQTNFAAFVVPRGAFWAPLRNENSVFDPAAQETLKAAKAELAALRSNPPPAVEMANGLQEGGVPESPHAGVHDVKIHIRGRYDRLGEIAPRQFPRILAGDKQTPITEGSGRLQLAKWIGSAENPLTARVMVNRIWQQHFGEGIVRTPNNYGKLGTPPTHPELLDYLSHRFIESGWSIKAMHGLMMLSATYQQASTASPATLKADPENKFFGRMNRRRLEAEPLRDSLLVVSGKLDRTLGGRALRELENGRRTLYLMMIRSDRSNYRMLFDAADPNSIVEQRVVSTVAPQALFLLNHPFMVAQSKSLAERVAKLDSQDDDERIQWLYEQLYARLPERTEMKVGRSMLSEARKAKAEDPWLEYCQVLLCANEFVYVD